MIANDLSKLDLQNLAREIFNSTHKFRIEGLPYEVLMPEFDLLPEHVQGYVLKALLESRIVNDLDAAVQLPIGTPDDPNIALADDSEDTD
jgi:hypothetical protein